MPDFSIADILARGYQQRKDLLAQPYGPSNALPALGALGQQGFQVADEQRKRQSVLQAQQEYANYLATPEDKRDPVITQRGIQAGIALGIQPSPAKTPDIADARIFNPVLKSIGSEPKPGEKPIPGTPANVKAAEFRLKEQERIANENKSKNDAATAKSEKILNDRKNLMGKDLDASGARAGQFGVSQQIINRSDRLQALASALPDGNLDSRQIEELAIGLNSMLSGSNAGAQEQVKSLVPNTVIGNAKKLQEWLTNEPTGTNQQAFVKRMLDSVQREREVASRQINKVQFARLGKYDDIRKKDPQGWETIVRSNGLDPDEYDAWRKGGYKDIGSRKADSPPPGYTLHKNKKTGETAYINDQGQVWQP